MVSKLRTHKTFSFSVRMKRSANAVAFGLPHEARRAFDAEEGDLLLKIVGQVVRPVVVTQPQPLGHAFVDAPEACPDALANRLQGLEAVAALGGVETDAFGRTVIDGHEDEGRPLGAGHGGRHVRAPHHVRSLGGDGSVVRLRPVRVARALRGLEGVLAHQPAHPLLRGAHPLDPQLRPGFPVPLAIKRRRVEDPAKVGHQDVVRGGANRRRPELLTSPRERRMVRHLEIGLQYGEDRPQEALCLTQGQAEHETERQSGLDCRVRELPRSPWPRWHGLAKRIMGLPVVQGIIVVG